MTINIGMQTTPRSGRICSAFCLFFHFSFCVWRTSGRSSRCVMTSSGCGTASSLTPSTCLTWGTSGRWVTAQDSYSAPSLVSQKPDFTSRWLICACISFILMKPIFRHKGPGDTERKHNAQLIPLVKLSTPSQGSSPAHSGVYASFWLNASGSAVCMRVSGKYLCQRSPGTCVGLGSDQRSWGSSVVEHILSHFRYKNINHM